MSDFFTSYNSSGKRRLAEYFLVGLAGALVGCLLLLTVFYFGFQDDWALFGAEGNNTYPAEPGNGEVQEYNREENGAGWQLFGDEPFYNAVVEAAEKATPSVVGIANYTTYQDFRGQSHLQERATGSGVIIDNGGLVITNFHVIEDAQEVTVTLGSGEEIPAEIVGKDAFTDLAVLKINKEDNDLGSGDLKEAAFADSGILRVGEPGIAIGNPLGLDFQQTVTLGVISATERQVPIEGQNFTFIQTDAAINAGNSGGPLVNIRGEVIGINTAKISLPGVEGMGFAIPSNMARDIAADLIEHGRVERPWLGVYTRDVNPTLAQIRGLAVEYGVLIEDIVSNSPAQHSGLEPEDVIIEIAGEKVENTANLLDIIYSYDVGDNVEIKVMRGSQEQIFEVALGSLPDNWS